MNYNYPIELAREILEKKTVKKTNYIPIQTKDNEIIRYKDDYIEILAGKNTKVLHVTIYKPLAPTGSNPIIYVDDEGKCFRQHGETGYFVMYAERMLDRELTIGLNEHNVEKQKRIDEYLKM